MAASKALEGVPMVKLQGEAPIGDAIGGIQSRHEGYTLSTEVLHYESEESGRVAVVVEAEAAGEAKVGDEAAPALANQGGTREGRRLRGEAEEDLLEKVVVIQRPLCHRRR
ncbi:hypothetical protein BRADI_4g07142v3 [Brachypodium distachyon]|uniref:Uncharacterized protein n=1 Tax=Brachypodium distachyon TaxID=15368 RepID=A0A0Q3EG37_BRADI|nr:hypothetical protein BRADI_4g07142v3 [Brachypodium distachyon]